MAKPVPTKTDEADFCRIRQSRRVRTVALALDVDESQIRRLIGAGELEAHRVGKRGIRIYLDSVEEYQLKNSRIQNLREPASKRSRAVLHNIAHRKAVAELKKAGLLR